MKAFFGIPIFKSASVQCTAVGIRPGMVSYRVGDCWSQEDGDVVIMTFIQLSFHVLPSGVTGGG